MRHQATRQVWEEPFTAEQHDRLSHGIAMRGGPQVGGESWNKVGMALRRISDRLTVASGKAEQGWSGSAAELEWIRPTGVVAKTLNLIGPAHPGRGRHASPHRE